MDWPFLLKDFKTFLRLEKKLSDKTFEAYLSDVKKLQEFIELSNKENNLNSINQEIFIELINWLTEIGIGARSQARIISGLRSFCTFLVLENYLKENPLSLIEMPKIGKKLPEVLSILEIDLIESMVDLSKAEGHRNKAIIETLYSCGLRVSELIGLKMSHLYLKEGFIRVVGKGDKERLVPISQKAINDINNYLPDRFSLPAIEKESEDILFLNRRGKKLSRVMIFTIVKELVKKTGIQKNVSPHTFRHSFATHLVDGGADLRTVQEMLGHESITTTELYTHLDRSYLKDTIFRFHPRS